jgi:integral membrane protein (TIGR01906 family)
VERNCRDNGKSMRVLKLSLSIFVILFLFFFSMKNVVFDKTFYFKEYEKNNVYDDVNKTTAAAATENLLNFLKGKESLSDFYSPREKAHMVDVKILINKLNFYYYLFLAALIVNIYLLYKWNVKDFTKDVTDSFILSAVGVILISLIVFVFRSNFSDWFTRFHLLFFNNDLWLLNPATDKLILLLPEQFFYDAFFQIILRLLISLISLFAIAVLIKFYARKSSRPSF